MHSPPLFEKKIKCQIVLLAKSLGVRGKNTKMGFPVFVSVFGENFHVLSGKDTKTFCLFRSSFLSSLYVSRPSAKSFSSRLKLGRNNTNTHYLSMIYLPSEKSSYSINVRKRKTNYSAERSFR